MATGGLYGSSLSGTLIAQPGTDSVGLYGSSIPYGGTYFEWFIFQQSATAPATLAPAEKEIKAMHNILELKFEGKESKVEAK